MLIVPTPHPVFRSKYIMKEAAKSNSIFSLLSSSGMACLKLFSGYLPEITNHIIQYLRKDLKSLHSCILVNRFLCLWEHPFSVTCREGYHCNLLDTYSL